MLSRATVACRIQGVFCRLGGARFRSRLRHLGRVMSCVIALAAFRAAGIGLRHHRRAIPTSVGGGFVGCNAYKGLGGCGSGVLWVTTSWRTASPVWGCGISAVLPSVVERIFAGGVVYGTHQLSGTWHIESCGIFAGGSGIVWVRHFYGPPLPFGVVAFWRAVPATLGGAYLSGRSRHLTKLRGLENPGFFSWASIRYRSRLRDRRGQYGPRYLSGRVPLRFGACLRGPSVHALREFRGLIGMVSWSVLRNCGGVLHAVSGFAWHGAVACFARRRRMSRNFDGVKRFQGVLSGVSGRGSGVFRVSCLRVLRAARAGPGLR